MINMFGVAFSKKRIGREVGRIFCYYFFFYCIQRTYETMKQNLVKFYTWDMN